MNAVTEKIKNRLLEIRLKTREKTKIEIESGSNSDVSKFLE
jgi:hypothetical protein